VKPGAGQAGRPLRLRARQVAQRLLSLAVQHLFNHNAIQDSSLRQWHPEKFLLCRIETPFKILKNGGIDVSKQR